MSRDTQIQLIGCAENQEISLSNATVIVLYLFITNRLVSVAAVIHSDTRVVVSFADPDRTCHLTKKQQCFANC